MKMHLDLATRDLELALDLDATAVAGHAEHFGIVVDSADAVEEKAARLMSAGIAIDIEREETCCYVVQTKLWASDPDGRRSETYVVRAETEARDESGIEPACCP